MGAKRVACVSRAEPDACVFCGLPTVVRVSVTCLDQAGQPEASRRICVHCFKAIITHMTAKPGP